MWTYQQSTGKFSRNGIKTGVGYSGFGAGKNNPALQDQHDVGPIPVGIYSISGPEWVTAPGPHGSYVLRLTPEPANKMFGRSGFLIHGDSISHPGQASKGCIILARVIRELVVRDNDWVLRVVA